MKHLSICLAALAIALISTAARLAPAVALDAYIIYGGKDKAQLEAVVAALPKDFKFSSYNVDLLALADYSGKQKAVAKFERADLIISIGEKPDKVLKGTRFKTDLFVVGSAKKGILSKGATAYVLASGTDT